MRRAFWATGLGFVGVALGMVLLWRDAAMAGGNPALVPMEVLRIASTPDGQAVVILRSASERKLLPIWIGDAEATAIQLRLNGRRPPRPLTHDLLERVIAQLGARLTKVHVEDLRDKVFYGRVFLRQGSRDLDIDARPSDSIALAVGGRVPILVARKVLDEAGVEDSPAPGRPDRAPDVSL
jgi:uncharacterized protein